MSSIQDRLREPDWWMSDTLGEEAADHIDTLEARVAELEAWGWEAMAHLSPEGCKAANAAALAAKEKDQ